MDNQESINGVKQKEIPFCKKCLLSEFNEAEYMEKLHKYIVTLDQKVKTGQLLYEKRLNVCKQCDKLNQGTCIGCGCYVELRAAMKHSRCPYKKW